ncbi:MAG: phosphoribosylglycinamide formyltransferase [Candidatus Methylomirabilis oxyfera]|nr:phosphoribosylglycinamide formyltransferase [Candidatus Methylomirabilis oxyfera]
MRGRIRLGVLASGRGSNLQAIIDASRAGRIDAVIGVVISDVADAFALERARTHGIEAVFVDPNLFEAREGFDAAIIDLLRKRDVDLVCLAGFMRLLSPPFVREYPNRIMNIHPALLPAFPGLHVQRKALKHGMKFSGCTVHFVDEGTDTGPIIIQAVVPVLDDDTDESLSARILTHEHQIYPRAIQLFAEGRLEVRGRRVFCQGIPASQQDERRRWGMMNP